MCGASAQQNELSTEEAQAYQDANARTAQQYAAQQAIYGPLSAQFQSIFAKGPNQRGFSTPELQGLNATAVEGTAENYSQAAKAVGEATAAEGGGTNPLPSGAQTQLKQEVANSAAGQESSEEESIQQADFAAGKNLWTAAGAGLEGIATGENPLGYETAATNSGNSANSEANAIEEANNSWIDAAIGAAGEIGGGFATAGCPAKGSRFLLYGGTYMLAEDLRVGDLLTGIDGESQAIRAIGRLTVPVVKITTDEGYILRCSMSHTFALPTGGFTTAAEALNRPILVGKMKRSGKVISLEPDGQDLVFNVVTDGSHSYCADGIWSLGN